ncbi:fumarylacetoacetate hydrolase family protein [Streptomyces sp. NPDC004629]|uniref:fumarylacetoacetate hydrolase family protein n=1 Tax=Streptomyces sp. NPDC004629 TaxID=3364705 RepID=UPI0036D0EAB7
MTLRLYCTPYGLAREEEDELVVLDLPHPDVGALLRDDFSLAGTASALLRLPARTTTLLAPLSHPGKVVLAGANYRDHVKEAGMPIPDAAVFITVTGSMVTGPYSDIVLPADASGCVDYEAELAVVIGVGGTNIPAARAWDHIAGLTVANDVSARDVQLAGMREGVITDTVAVARGKTYPTFKPLGPAVVTTDEFARPLALDITTWVNGEVRQHSNTDQMLFSVPEIIETVSASVPLEAGDVVLTGTPAGVALASGRYLQAGDIVEIRIDQIGHLRNKVISAR